MRAWNKRTRDSMPSTMLRHRVGFLVGWLVARELIIKITQNRRTTVEQPAGTPGGRDLGDQAPTEPSALSRTLARALNVTVPTSSMIHTSRTTAEFEPRPPTLNSCS